MNRSLYGPYSRIKSKTREISVDDEYEVLGVETDESVKRVRFISPRYVEDGIDLSKLHVFVAFQNANGQKSMYLVEDLVVVGPNSDKVIFSWLLSGLVTAYKGNVSYVVCAKAAREDGTLVTKWNTKPATGRVDGGLNADTVIEEQHADVIEQILARLDAIPSNAPSGFSGVLIHRVGDPDDPQSDTYLKSVERGQLLYIVAGGKDGELNETTSDPFVAGQLYIYSGQYWNLLIQHIWNDDIVPGHGASRINDVLIYPDYVSKENIVNEISEDSRSNQIPSAKCMYDILGKVEDILKDL